MRDLIHFTDLVEILFFLECIDRCYYWTSFSKVIDLQFSGLNMVIELVGNASFSVKTYLTIPLMTCISRLDLVISLFV